MRDSIDFIWRCLELDERENYKTKEHIEQCELVIPDSDDFQSKNVSYAQDAGLAVCNALDYLLSESVNHIVWIGTHATDSVDLYIQESENINPDDPELETKVLCHRLMQRELAEQVRNLNEIQNAVVPFSRDFLIELRNSWQNSGRSNLDLP